MRCGCSRLICAARSARADVEPEPPTRARSVGVERRSRALSTEASKVEYRPLMSVWGSPGHRGGMSSHVRAIIGLALAASVGLAGCGGSATSSGAPTPAGPAAASPRVTDSGASSGGGGAPTTPAAADKPTPAPTPASPVADVKKYGVSSPECKASSTVLMAATKIGGLASQGKVTQADFDSAYSGAASNDVPFDLVPIYANLKTASLKVVGKDQAGASQYLGEFSDALGRFTSAVQIVCS